MSNTLRNRNYPQISVLSVARLDQVLALWNPEHSRNTWQKVICEGGIRVNHEIVKKTRFQVKYQDLITIETMPALPPAKLSRQKPEEELKILFENDAVIVVNKSPNLVVHPFPGSRQPCLVHYLLDHCHGQLAHADGNRPGLIHRLDKDTSGCLLAAKNDACHHFLSRKLARREISRIYLALVYGHVAHARRLVHHSTNNPKQPMRKLVRAVGRLMMTDVFPLMVNQAERSEIRSLVACRLHTGRTHQIRLQLSHIGHPVIGDRLYGNHTRTQTDRQCLHAASLEFPLPQTQEIVSVIAPPPEDFIAACQASNLDLARDDCWETLIKKAKKFFLKSPSA